MVRITRSQPRTPSDPPASDPARPTRLTAARAQDVLLAYVRAVLDGRTVDLNLLDLSPAQRERYQDNELVRLVGAAFQEASSAACADLLTRFHRRRVRCFVHGRDASGMLLAVVVPVAV